jgi:hypothetical protein
MMIESIRDMHILVSGMWNLDFRTLVYGACPLFNSLRVANEHGSND